jgi:hypothetical protein
MQSGRETAADQDGIVSSVKGGLDLVSSRLVMPPENSPNLLNVEIMRDGSVSKRRGFRRELLINNENFRNEYPGQFYSFNLLAGYPILLVASQGTLVTHFLPDSAYPLTGDVQRIAFAGRVGVFRSNEHVDCTVVREPNKLTRCILTQRDTTPIQLTTQEFNQVRNVTIDGQSGKAFYAPGLQNIIGNTDQALGHAVFYINGIARYNPADVGRYDPVTKEVLVRDVYLPGGSVGNLLMVWSTVQYWCEALKVEGTQVIGRSVQGTVSPADRLVAVPPDLLAGITSSTDILTTAGYPIRPFTSSNPGSVLSWLNPPTTANNYTFSNGSTDTSAPVPRSPNFILTGAPPGTARTLLFSRGYTLPFIGGLANYNANQLGVYEISGTSTARPTWIKWQDASLGIVTRSYYRRAQDYTVLNTGNTITLDANSLGDVSSESQYVICAPRNDGAGTYFGTSNEVVNYLVEGGAWVTFGISNFSDYGANQSHPSVSTVWQGRLVLAGWKDDPLRVAVSAVGDTSVVGWFYNDFQLALSDLGAAGAFDFVLPTSNDDYITAVREFQGSLFIFTRDRLFRMTLGENGANVRLVSNNGAGNSRCVTDLEGTIVFMGSSGVYVIQPTRDEFDYQAVSISEKISPIFEELGTERGWLAFSQQHQLLFVGLGNHGNDWFAAEKQGNGDQLPSNLRYQTTDHLYVYSAIHSAWSKWSGLDGEHFDAMGGCAVRRSDSITTVMVGQSYFGDPCGTLIADTQRRIYSLLEWGFEKQNADVFIYAAGAPIVGSHAVAVTPMFSYNANEAETELFCDRSRSLKLPSRIPSTKTLFGGFRMCPISDLRDVAVYPYNDDILNFPNLNTVSPLQPDTHYYKTPHNTLVLTDTYFENNTVLIIYGRTREDGTFQLPYALKADEKFIDFTLVNSPGNGYLIPLVAYTNKLEILVTFPSWYASPHWYRQGIGYKKRTTTYMGYYNHNNERRVTRSNKGAMPYTQVGSPLNRQQFDLIVSFSDENTGYTDADVYGADALTWDYSSLDISSPVLQNQEYARIAVPIIGSGYNLQVWNYSMEVGSFRLVGYELRSNTKKGRGINNNTD